jgi:hypothetical protein
MYNEDPAGTGKQTWEWTKAKEGYTIVQGETSLGEITKRPVLKVCFGVMLNIIDGQLVLLVVNFLFHYVT